jgi:HAD superfamily hydrolase (TIGR01509 family)
MIPIRHVVFDIGRVLITWDPEVPFRRLIPDEAVRAHFLTYVCSPAWNLEQDRGRPWDEAEAMLIAEHPDHEANIRAFRQHWMEMVASEISETVAIMRGLMASGMDVTLLTNFASDTFREARVMYPFLTETRGVTVSGEVKVLKPDPQIYRIHSASFGLDPAATLFIDDSAANVRGAQAFGWQAVLFERPAKLREDLQAFGLVI